jgi:hypothetical protein
MLMVIFGAGASFDSCPTYPPGSSIPTGDAQNDYHRPPLADQLFVNRPVFSDTLLTFPECQKIAPYLRHLPAGKTLESVLQDLQSAARTYSRGQEQFAEVRCYLHQVIWQSANRWLQVAKGLTNYKTLPTKLIESMADSTNRYASSRLTMTRYSKKHFFIPISLSVILLTT